MKISLKKFVMIVLTTVSIGVSYTAQAVIIPFSDNLPDYSSPSAGSGFPIDLGVVDTFNFMSGNVLVATVSGTWGNVAFPTSSAGADLFIDGLLVAQCIEFDPCWQNATGTQNWSYSFSALDLASGILDDGIADLQVIQTSGSTVRLGALSIVGRVDTQQVPEPGTLALLGLGLAGLGFARRKKATPSLVTSSPTTVGFFVPAHYRVMGNCRD